MNAARLKMLTALTETSEQMFKITQQQWRTQAMMIHCSRSLPALITACALAQAQSIPGDPSADWLVNPAPYKAEVRERKSTGELILENGLARRVIRLTPNAATVTLENLVSGEHLIRAVAPEARVNIDGNDYPVGGLKGQRIQNYLKADWIGELQALPGSYQFSKWEEQPVSKRLDWKKRPEWLARDHPSRFQSQLVDHCPDSRPEPNISGFFCNAGCRMIGRRERIRGFANH